MKKHRLLVAVFASLAIYGWSGDSEIIVESYSDGLNAQAFSTVEGRWLESTGKSTAPGVKATKTVFNDANKEPGVAKFTPDIPVAGKYEVFITYPVQGNASDIKYTVVSSEGSKDITVTQFGRDLGTPAKADEWFSLGVYDFAAGTAGSIQVTDPMTGEYPYKAETNARIYADAVKLVPQGFSLPAEYVNKPGATAPTALAETAPTPAATSTPAATPAPEASAPAVAAASTPASSELPSLPASTPAAAMPGLPAATDPAASGLPALPGASAPVAGLPALPGAASPAGLPALPTVTPGLPALPEASTAAALPGLPGAATPIPAPDFAKLVTPTPANRRPSPSDTPAPALPPLPGPGMPALPTGVGAPAVPALPPVAGLPPVPALPGTAAPAAAVTPSTELSITQYNPSGLQWVYDFGSGLNQARAQNKKVMVFFTASGNQTAAKYETEYFSHPAVRQALENYVIVKIDFPKNTRLSYSLGVFGAGIIAVTDTSGNVTARIQQLPPTPTDLITAMSAVKVATSASADATSDTAAVPAVPGAEAAPAAVPAAPDPGAAAPAEVPALPAIPGVEAAPAAPAPAAAAVPAAPAPATDAAATMPALPNVQ